MRLIVATVLVASLCAGCLASNFVDCPQGWSRYSAEPIHTCLWWSDSDTSYLSNAQSSCASKNSSLIVINSDEKFKYFKQTLKTFDREGNDFWLPLVKINGTVIWQTNDGDNLTADYLPKGLEFDGWSEYEYQNTQGVLVNTHYKQMYLGNNYRSSGFYVCERRPVCEEGWFGAACDRQCHCHQQPCEPTDLEVTCLFGCQVGWMGPGCSQRKEDADVRYFCVNSEDQGKYAQFTIDTKGVEYKNINPVDENSSVVSWCKGTEVTRNGNYVIIKAFVNNATTQSIADGACAGKIATDGKYEWRLKIQEIEGVVSRNDQEVSIECDFSKGDKFVLTEETDIERERWFRRSDIRKPIEYLQEKKEVLTLEIVDPATGDPVIERKIGSPVALKLNFGIKKDHAATGVQPYNCDAASPDGKERKQFLDFNGCAVGGFYISEFHRTEGTSLITNPFPLFGFNGNEKIEFHCSYRLCFGDDACATECKETSEEHRHRRSTDEEEKLIKGSVTLTA